jgi:hypothetical protein
MPGRRGPLFRHNSLWCFGSEFLSQGCNKVSKTSVIREAKFFRVCDANHLPFVPLPSYDRVHFTFWIVLVRLGGAVHGAPVQESHVTTETKKTNNKGRTDFEKDRRRKHHHYLVTVFYADGEKFGRVYTDKDKATRFAERQRRSPVVKMARVSQVS